jgi:Uma2 family endonuclease
MRRCMEVAWYDRSAVLDYKSLYPEQIRRTTREEYEQLVALGFFEGEHVELLYGQVVQMSPQGNRHRMVSARMNTMLAQQVPAPYVVQGQGGLGLWPDSSPEPDVAVVPDVEELTEALLVVEVAMTSFEKDMKIKAPLYARAGIAAYWVVDLTSGVVHVMTAPVDGRYTQVEQIGRGGVLACAGLPGVAIQIDELFRHGTV